MSAPAEARTGYVTPAGVAALEAALLVSQAVNVRLMVRELGLLERRARGTRFPRIEQHVNGGR